MSGNLQRRRKTKYNLINKRIWAYIRKLCKWKLISLVFIAVKLLKLLGASVTIVLIS